MTDKTEAQSEALELADRLIGNAEIDECEGCNPVVVALERAAAAELRRLHAEIQQLKAQLSARQAAPDGQVDAARRRLAEALPQAADCFHPLYIEGFKSGHAKGRVRGERATLREVGAFAEAILAAPPPPEREPLTDEQIEKLRKDTFSTDNPFCPCDRKTMQKAVRAAERAHGIGATND
ncbi:hypothetical protein [Comamonas sp. MYb69]|uniref:hypothetical protein n=1 Tax=Comamonas sp. MYb69 TaxID=1848650 RepID=UPI0030958941